MFNQRKNKRFSYKPRFQDSAETNNNSEFQDKWNEVKPSSKRKGSILTSLPALIIMLIAIIVLMYILDGYMK